MRRFSTQLARAQPARDCWLVGVPPAALTLAPPPLGGQPPPCPPTAVATPRASARRRRRRTARGGGTPDRRRVAAFFPSLASTASGGVRSSSLAQWLTWPSRSGRGPRWRSPSSTMRRVGRHEPRLYRLDEEAASYRQGCLNALQDVEDNLAAQTPRSRGRARTTGGRRARTALDVSLSVSRRARRYLPVVVARSTLLSTSGARQSRCPAVRSRSPLIKATGSGSDSRRGGLTGTGVGRQR